MPSRYLCQRYSDGSRAGAASGLAHRREVRPDRERLRVGDLANEGAVAVLVAEGEQEPLAGVPVAREPTDVAAVVGELDGVGQRVGPERPLGPGEPDASGGAARPPGG